MVREWSGGTNRGLGVVRSGREALPEVWVWSGVPPGGPGVVGRPFRRSGVVGRPSRRSGSGRETLLEIWEWSGSSPKVRELSRFTPVGSGMVWRPSRGPRVVDMPSRRSGSDRGNIFEVRVWSGVVGSGRETLPDFREWLRGPPGGPGVIGRPSRRFGCGREGLPEVREWSGDLRGVSGVVGTN